MTGHAFEWQDRVPKGAVFAVSGSGTGGQAPEIGADAAPGRQAIIHSVERLRAQTGLVEDAAEELGLDITTGS